MAAHLAAIDQGRDGHQRFVAGYSPSVISPAPLRAFLMT